MQAMFIDVDGTLSSPCYKVNGKFQIGMSDVQWADYCSKHGEDTYAVSYTHLTLPTIA